MSWLSMTPGVSVILHSVLNLFSVAARPNPTTISTISGINLFTSALTLCCCMRIWSGNFQDLIKTNVKAISQKTFICGRLGAASNLQIGLMQLR